MELARRLETQGFNGRLILIDGAPGPLKALITKDMSGSGNEDFENKCLLMMLNILAPHNISKLNAELETCKNWDEKVKVYTELVSDSKLGLNFEYQKNLCTTMYKRLVAIMNYDASELKPIEAPITLLKPTIKSLQTELEDYGLSEITKNQVEVHYITGNHVTILENDMTADIINERIYE